MVCYVYKVTKSSLPELACNRKKKILLLSFDFKLYSILLSIGFDLRKTVLSDCGISWVSSLLFLLNMLQTKTSNDAL